MERSRKADPSTPAATAPKAGAKDQVAASAQADTIYETSSRNNSGPACVGVTPECSSTTVLFNVRNRENGKGRSSSDLFRTLEAIRVNEETDMGACTRSFRKFVHQDWPAARLDRGWIIANHKLVSFHAAFLTSLISISPLVNSRVDVIRQMFLSVEVLISCAIWYIAWHTNIAIHEMGHYLEAVRTNNLRPELAGPAQERLNQPWARRAFWYLEMFVKIPYGAFPGVNKEAGSFHPSVKTQNLAVSAAGPQASRTLMSITFFPGIILVGLGLWGKVPGLVYAGRLLFTVGVVALFDTLLSDPGKFKAYRERQREAALKASEVHAALATAAQEGRTVNPAELRRKLRLHRLQEVKLPDGRVVFAPWEFRNSIMGGRHTEEMGGNLSFQELMFLPLTARDYIEAQRVTNMLQSRAIQIIQDTEGLNFVGIGLEGGIVASYAKEKGDLLPEERALRVAVQAIEECGFVPDRDVVLALDPAASELTNAYREKTGEKDAVGQYLFWRAEDPKVLSTEEMVDLYVKWVKKYPIVSLEDGFAEDDYEGWKKLMKALDQEILIIGDDLVTTKDSTIARCADEGLINTALIKANQIGTLAETLLATRTAKEHGLALVVSHRSKSPNEVMEADIAFAVGALGLKCGGGANTERLVKYSRIVELMEMAKKGLKPTRAIDPDLIIADISAHEEPTNAGIPTVGVVVMLDNGMKFTAATPLGTSAGSDEAIHLVDSIIEAGPLTRKFPQYFVYKEKDKTYRFIDNVKGDVLAKESAELAELWVRTKRYGGKGCLNAVANVTEVLAPRFLGQKISALGTPIDIDRELLLLELDLAIKRGKIAPNASAEEKISIMQRKANLGMNAVLSLSLALGRVVAARDGRELPDVLRDLEMGIDREYLYGVKSAVAVR
jgi:enolase